MAVGSCTRSFELQGTLSDATTSTCGLPEGDALSVYGLCNDPAQLFQAHYVRAFCPSVRALSFVDNKAPVADVPDLLAMGLACLVEFFRMWNLQVEAAKSYCWPFIKITGINFLRFHSNVLPRRTNLRASCHLANVAVQASSRSASKHLNHAGKH